MPDSTEEERGYHVSAAQLAGTRQPKPGREHLTMYFSKLRNHPQHADCALPPALPSVSRVLCAGVSSPGASSTCVRQSASVNNALLQRVCDFTAAGRPHARHQHLDGRACSMKLADLICLGPEILGEASMIITCGLQHP